MKFGKKHWKKKVQFLTPFPNEIKNFRSKGNPWACSQSDNSSSTRRKKRKNTTSPTHTYYANSKANTPASETKKKCIAISRWPSTQTRRSKITTTEKSLIFCE